MQPQWSSYRIFLIQGPPLKNTCTFMSLKSHSGQQYFRNSAKSETDHGLSKFSSSRGSFVSSTSIWKKRSKIERQGFRSWRAWDFKSRLDLQTFKKRSHLAWCKVATQVLLDLLDSFGEKNGQKKLIMESLKIKMRVGQNLFPGILNQKIYHRLYLIYPS